MAFGKKTCLKKPVPQSRIRDYKAVSEWLEFVRANAHAARKSENQELYDYWTDAEYDLIERWWKVYGDYGASTAWNPTHDEDEDDDRGYSHQLACDYLESWIECWKTHNREIRPFWVCNDIDPLQQERDNAEWELIMFGKDKDYCSVETENARRSIFCS